MTFVDGFAWFKFVNKLYCARIPTSENNFRYLAAESVTTFNVILLSPQHFDLRSTKVGDLRELGAMEREILYKVWSGNAPSINSLCSNTRLMTMALSYAQEEDANDWRLVEGRRKCVASAKERNGCFNGTVKLLFKTLDNFIA